MFISDNIAFSAYLLHQGIKMLEVQRQRRRVWWVFDLPQEEGDRLYAAWVSSSESEYFSKYLALKTEMKNAKRKK